MKTTKNKIPPQIATPKKDREVSFQNQGETNGTGRNPPKNGKTVKINPLRKKERGKVSKQITHRPHPAKQTPRNV